MSVPKTVQSPEKELFVFTKDARKNVNPAEKNSATNVCVISINAKGMII